jgi:hypothetical protein
MTIHRSKNHLEQVEAWEKVNCENLSAQETVSIYSTAILAIRQRSLATLSSVTLTVVEDRALHQSLEKYPFLSEIKLLADGINFDDLHKASGRIRVPELKEAMRHFLIEFLTVLGNITADVLTAPLHRELTQVTRESISKMNESQSTRVLRSVKTNRGES